MRSAAGRGPFVLVVLSLLVLMGSAGLVGATTADGDDIPGTTIRIALQPDGDARTTVTMRIHLDSDIDARSFERLAEEFENGEANQPSVDPFRQAAELASESTDRSMSIVNVSRSATRTNETGRLSLSFTWTSFAQVSGSRMRVGDVFRTPSGTWLPELQADQVLIIEFPPGYSVVSASRGYENRTFHIRGPETFAPGQPWVTLDRQGGATRTTGETRTPIASFWERTTTVGLGVGFVILFAAVLLAYRRLDTGRPVVDADTEGGSPEQRNPDAGGGPGVGTAPVDEPGRTELLSDEERVLQLLHGNDGRMKQADIVAETDWSNAKVSQLLSEMEDKNLIEKLRIGRENLISLPGESPDEVG